MSGAAHAIDLNADLGELPGADGRALDAAILAHVTSASVACGGHAGDPETMRRTFAAAKAAGVRLGAHPSYPDREGFGRRSLAMTPAGLTDTLAAQVAAAEEAASAEGVTLAHLKPHGALYHDARGEAVADAVCGVAAAHGLDLFGPPSGAMIDAAKARGIGYVAEGFADRAYRRGALVSRSEPGAVLEDEADQARQAIRLATGASWPDGPAQAVRTICLHGDTPGAARAAGRLRAALEEAGVRIEAAS